MLEQHLSGPLFLGHVIMQRYPLPTILVWPKLSVIFNSNTSSRSNKGGSLFWVQSHNIVTEEHDISVRFYRLTQVVLTFDIILFGIPDLTHSRVDPHVDLVVAYSCKCFAVSDALTCPAFGTRWCHAGNIEHFNGAFYGEFTLPLQLSLFLFANKYQTTNVKVNSMSSQVVYDLKLTLLNMVFALK